jgi:UDP-N-acetylglucosamine--N-acetylmuramyl-(pentapeptide) pyrophosphoryl-undecaprenol N-acetylglucosamine transferase
MTRFAVIAGGGTAGHVLPALAIAEGLVDHGNSLDEILYLGAERGIETRLVPPTGIDHRFFDVVGLQRGWSPRTLAKNLVFLPKLWRARRSALRLMREDRPRVVVSVGGYASLPAVLAARRLGIPVVVVSYDRTPGRSSRLTARFAAATAVAFPGSDLPRARWTGAPVRRAVRTVDRVRDRDRARELLGVPKDRFLVAVVGGSLGSRVLNQSVADLVEESKDDASLAVFHVVGERFLDEHRAAAGMDLAGMDLAGMVRSGDNGVWYRVVGYENRMSDVYAACDMLIGRGGAGTVADVATVGIPAILIPWSGASDDHQRANVAWLSDDDAALMIDEQHVTSELATSLRELRSNPDRLERLASRARALGEPNRGGAIPDLIHEVAEGSRR